MTDVDLTVPSIIEPDVVEEASILDETPSDVVTDVAEYETVEDGSIRGQHKLFNRGGFSFTVKTRTARATVWRCSVRNARVKCKVTVRQVGAVYTAGAHPHLHQPAYGGAVAARVAKHIKGQATENVFRPALQIVREVVARELGAAPCPVLPQLEYLVRTGNYAKQKGRPLDPVDLDYSLQDEHVADGFLQRDVKKKMAYEIPAHCRIGTIITLVETAQINSARALAAIETYRRENDHRMVSVELTMARRQSDGDLTIVIKELNQLKRTLKKNFKEKLNLDRKLRMLEKQVTESVSEPTPSLTSTPRHPPLTSTPRSPSWHDEISDLELSAHQFELTPSPIPFTPSPIPSPHPSTSSPHDDIQGGDADDVPNV